MDDFAPAPAQRTSDDSRRITEANFAARKKAAKKEQPAPAKLPDPDPEAEPAPESEANHQLDVLA